MKHVKNILHGVRQVLVISPGSKYQRPSRHEFSKDAANLRKDMGLVAKDMRKAIKEYGK